MSRTKALCFLFWLAPASGGCLGTAGAGAEAGSAQEVSPGKETAADDPLWSGHPPPARVHTVRLLPPGVTGRYSSATLPGGVTCLIRLRELGVSFEAAGRVRGVDTPVRLRGPVGGIALLPLASPGRHRALMDCRLALALERAGPYLRNLGLQALHFSSSYRYGRMPSGKLSRHAMGLALDVHRLTVRGQELSVEDDFVRGLSGPCDGALPLINRVACLLRELGLMDRVLTPDTDAAHHNHLHLAILSQHSGRKIQRVAKKTSSIRRP